LAAQPFKSAQGLQLTASIGVASYHAGNSIDQLIAAADNALYKAKAQGRNQVCLSEPLTVASLL
tara:strand:- start:464 stop:655 length:192 start_codon:yes stop_codon:yes gene_type:complete